MPKRGKVLRRIVIPLLIIFGLMLAGTLTASIAMASRVSKRVLCATNLSVIGKSLSLYASANGNHFPAVNKPANRWLCDEPTQFTSAILNVNPASPANPKTLYCPSNPAQSPKTMSNWNGISVWGYIYFNDRAQDAANPSTSNHSAETPLAADWIVSDSTTATANTGTPEIKRPGPSTLTFNTSHTVNRTTAAGANVLTADNSVHWRNFTPATATPIKQPGSVSLYFWLPANE